MCTAAKMKYHIVIGLLLIALGKVHSRSINISSTTPPANSESTLRPISVTLVMSPTFASTTTDNPPKTTLDTLPIFTKIKTPSALQDKIQSLRCNIPLLSTDFTIWQGNETHELLLPIIDPGDCAVSSGSGKTTIGNSSEENDVDFTSACQEMFTWEASVEMQSGDILLVRIDDAQLILQATFNNTSNETERFVHEPNTSVYQVTRTGHENCDVTEGVLLDITPLKIDNRKVVTLYDKDLTLGVNLLIVVSELWARQCIRLKVTLKSDNCGENEDCSGKGICYSNASMDGYECQCCLGSVGQHCEEHDACYPNPCINNGICVDISQGHDGNTFQCLCPYGYAGRNCEDRTSPCSSMPCQNGATCKANGTGFECVCPLGYTGDVCQQNRNECVATPCVHGICVEEDNGYKCFCEPGFTGTNCEYEYNECESSPCDNGGTCTDQIGGFLCSCGRGYDGKRCQIKVDLCEPNPCLLPRHCFDHGNNYSCDCPQGYTGPDCLLPAKSICSTNPCLNGGTCFSSTDSFYCACQPDFTGTACEDEFVIETINAVDTYNTKETQLGVEIPININMGNLHNVYMAGGTLICALILVILIVLALYCRVNKTYKHFILKSHIQWPCKSRRGETQTTTAPNNTDWFSGKDKGPTATPGRCLPSLDTTDMFYTLDLTESQSSPLIQ